MTKPSSSLFNHPNANDAMNEDIQELLPWVRESWGNAAALWCALSNVEWKKGDLEFGVTFRGAGAYVGELYHGSEKYNPSSFDYLEFYCSGETGVIHPKIGEYLAARGWAPHDYGAGEILSSKFRPPKIYKEDA